VADKDYIERLRQFILHLHGTDSLWVETMHVHEVFKLQTVWYGDVEVFALLNHPKAMRAYAWSYKSGDLKKFTAVLEIPPVKDAQTAVRASIWPNGLPPHP
jgi:hypothetical protein